MHACAMNESLSTLQRSFSCLGHGSRLRIVLSLLGRPMFVSELATEVELSQSCTTRHLQVLAGAGLVLGRRQGKRVVFEVDRSAPLFAALEALEARGRTAGAGLSTDRSSGAYGEWARPDTAGVRRGRRNSAAASRKVVQPPVSAAEDAGPPRPRDLEDFLL